MIFAALTTMDAVSATIVAGRWAQFKNTQRLDELNNFSFNLMNLLKSFVCGLGQYMRKAARHSGGVDS